MSEDFTAKFRVDISDLKKNISEATKQIKLANATFSAETAGMDRWSKNADGLSKKLEQLKSVLVNQKTILSSYEQQLKKQQQGYEENGKKADQLKAKLQELANNGVKKTDEEYRKYLNALKTVLKEQQNNEKACEDLKIQILEQQAAVNKTESDIKHYSSFLKTLEAEQRAAAEAANRQKTAYENLESTIGDQESKLEALKREYANVVLEQGKTSTAAENLAKEIDNLSSELQDNKSKLNDADKAADELDNSLEEVGNSAEKSSSGFTVMKGALANLVADGIRKAVTAMKDFVVSSIDVGREFDASMSQVAAVSGATGTELQTLRDKAKEMGANTKFSASEAADAFNYMAMAGWKTEDMLSGIEGILGLAAAGNTDLAKTSDIVTDALTAFGASANDAGRLADIMAAASSNANTNVEMMGETFKYVAPVAGAMGYSMEDASVAIGLMANAGIKGSQAGTSLRSVLTRLAAPPKEAADAMNELGIEITNTDGTMKPLSEVIEILRQKFDGLSEAEQTQYAKSLAGQEAMSGLLSIVNASPADFDKLTDAVNNSNGAAEKMAETMQDNLGGDITKLGSQFEGVQIALYEKFEPALRAGADALSGLLDKLSWVIEHGEQITAIIIGVGTAVGTFLTIINRQAILTAFIGLISKVKNGFLAFNAVLAANPIGLVVSAIAGLIAAFVYLWNTSEDFRNFWIGLWEKIKEVAEIVWIAITSFFSEAWDKIQKTWEGAVEWFTNLWTGIKIAWNSVVEFFTNLFKNAWTGIKNAWSTVTQWFADTWTNIKKPFQIAGQWFSNIFKNAWTGIKNAWSAVTGWFSNTWTNIKKPFLKVKDFFVGAFKGAYNGITNIFKNIGNWFKTVFNNVKDAIKSPINFVIRGLNKLIGGLNKISFDIPDWVPVIGGKKFGFNIGKIPELARGGILKRGQVGLLEGDGAEAVIPLERNKQWIKAVANEILDNLQPGPYGGGGTNNLNKNNAYNFTQIINAPKQPSRIELYRQTKNLLSLAERGI